MERFFLLSISILSLGCRFNKAVHNIIKTSSDTLNVQSYMYWYDAHINKDWENAVALIKGRITSIQNIKERDSTLLSFGIRNHTGGAIQIDSIFFAKPTKGDSIINQKYIILSDGLSEFSIGDSLLVYFIRYENKYAFANGCIKKANNVTLKEAYNITKNNK